MKEQQNLHLIHPTYKTDGKKPTPINETLTLQSSKKISSPKFNRKTDSNQRNRICSPLSYQNHNLIHFISPNKQSKCQDVYSKTSPFQFCQQAIEARYKQQMIENNKMSRNPETFRLLTQRKEQKGWQKDQDLISKVEKKTSQTDKLFGYVLQLKKQNKDLTKKLKDFQGIRQFLIQRQNFIFELSQINSKNAEQKAILIEKVSKLTLAQQTLQKNVDQERQRLLKSNQQLALLCQTQKNQLLLQQKQITRLQKEIKSLKKQQQKETYSQKQKENICQNNIQKAQRSPKAKHIFYNKLEYIKLQKDDKKSWKEQRSPSRKNSEFKMGQQKNILLEKTANYQESNYQHFQSQPQDQTIKTLRQKLRYSQIQVDVLNKIKDSSLKIKDQNQKLKAVNRKHLARIQYFSKKLAKRNDSDSSFQLSLTPKKTNGFN